ncbi:alpha/beta fold hydrolase [Saccharopolyspora indica]|uniref:alpha/beta hydrolase n=1 Tax=Saccharopolyspora indica TaxID=1229659 RepID=UPI0022EB66E1|nr:alpha/beta hydrolase [Saccharopolyspora indica]MDA3647683.1 alpha/beta fold hydrolase [Saccharopolyspora indica]
MTETLGSTAEVREVRLNAGAAVLSGLLARPSEVPPKAVVLALPGGGMRAGYFHGPAHRDLSLLDLGASLGYAVLALDRPGYGSSAATAPQGMTLADQASTVLTALAGFAAAHEIGAGFFVVAHSYGGKLALAVAAESGGTELLGLDISGCGREYAVDPREHLTGRSTWRLHWGPGRLYPPGTFRSDQSPVAPMPVREVLDAASWPGRIAELAPRVRVPVRFTFAEYERWWRHDAAAVEELAALFAHAPEVVIARQANAGHNISLGWAARAYHLRALAFAEDCAAELAQARVRLPR